jgi:tripartite-type tricarboxylate transporter receptor subunit TctC
MESVGHAGGRDGPVVVRPRHRVSATLIRQAIAAKMGVDLIGKLLAVLLTLLVSDAAVAAESRMDGSVENYPDRPIKLVVPFPPGGPTDTTARIFADHMSKQLGQPIVIENRPGANSAIGAQLVARSPADGYTLLFAMDVTMVMNPITMPGLAYKPLEDFDPISLTAYNTSLLVVPANGPSTVAELIRIGRENPGKLNFGAGIITTQLAAVLFNSLTGIQAIYIPYKGSAEVVQGLLNGSIDYSIDGVSAHYSLIKSGQERALAKLNNNPLKSLPKLVPLSEAANIPQLGEVSTWAGIVAPHGTPKPILEKLRAAIANAAADPTVEERLLAIGVVATSSTADEFKRYVATETDRWLRVVGEHNLKFE